MLQQYYNGGYNQSLEKRCTLMICDLQFLLAQVPYDKNFK